jgi:SWI/SNF-related matrix-associated actin-dependent regulator 1 of chromatin subfamily A
VKGRFVVFDAPLSAAVAVRPYQHTGAHWLVRNLRVTRALLLCDDPGLGKSVQALHAADQLAARRVCIVSPAGARRVWLHEITKWFPKWLPRVVIVEPGTLVRAVELEAEDVIVLVSYDALSHGGSQMAATLKRLSWDLLIIDEAHYLKGKSNRTAALYGHKGTDQGIQASAERVILLTGTPTPNHAGELYQHIRTFWPGVLRTLEYADRDMPEASFI